MKIEVKETRGAKPRYNFEGFQVGEIRYYHGTTTGRITGSVKSYCRNRDLNWKFRSYTENKKTALVRVQ